MRKSGAPGRPRGRHLTLADEAVTPAARRRNRLVIFVLIDALAIALASAAAVRGSGLVETRQSLYWLLAFDVLVFLALTRRGFYRLGMGSSLLDEVARLLGVTASVGSAIIVVRVVLMPAPDVGGETVRLWAFVTAYLAAGRIALSLQMRRRRRAGGALPTLIVGAGQVGQLVGARLLQNRQLGLLPVGFLDDDPFPGRHPVNHSIPLLGKTDDLETVVSTHHVAHVVVCFSAVTHEVLLDVVRRARRADLDVSLVPRLYEEVTCRVAVGHLGGIPLLQVDQANPRGFAFSVKYALDRVAAAVALASLAPVMLVVALAVKLSSPGPILYRQQRVGLDGREFDILKFRTMFDSPAAAEEPDECVADAMLRQKSPLVSGDRRTPLGKWLRKLSLDELPQIINVARGEMSLVGPRPERPSLAQSFERHVYRYGERHRVKSGITGWAQVHGLRGQSSLADRAEWDNYYIENWSPWLDLKILVLTLPAILRGDNDG
ncbi:MAG: sugar transferase [Actinomycetota bacterium]|nr:sugar transferase [Actinomycetota bacterium]